MSIKSYKHIHTYIEYYYDVVPIKNNYIPNVIFITYRMLYSLHIATFDDSSIIYLFFLKMCLSVYLLFPIFPGLVFS